jgi:hypothetical protein
VVNHYDELLKLCGFEDDEIKREKPRIDQVFQRLELVPEDMKTAERWVRQNHDIELLGVRKLLRAWLLELLDMVLARDEGKKIVYYGFPSILGPGAAIKTASELAGVDTYCACPDVILCHTLGQIFNKLTPVLEAGEENGLPPGHGLCALQQIRVGGMAKGIIPVPDLVTGSSYFCDMGSKADELLHERYGHPAVYVDGSMDSKWGEYPYYSPERVDFFGGQLDKLFEKVREVLRVEVTRAVWDKAMSSRNHFASAAAQLLQYMMVDPMPLSTLELYLALLLSAGGTGKAATEGPEAVGILCQEVKERVDKGIGVVEKGAPRVMSFSPSLSDPSIMHMMEGAGLAMLPLVGGSAYTVVTPPSPLATFGAYIADQNLKEGAYHSSYGLVKLMESAVRSMDVDGFIWNYTYNCRPMAQTSHTVRKWVEETTGIPTISVETDHFDSRNYGAAALRTRVEAFAEMLRARKVSSKV